MRACLPCSLPRLGNIAEVDLGIAPPVMKSFKEFLLSLDDSIDETEAVKRYNDYKLEFRRQQMQDFFLAHKDEEWYVSRGLGLLLWWRGAWGGGAGLLSLCPWLGAAGQVVEQKKLRDRLVRLS